MSRQRTGANNDLNQKHMEETDTLAASKTKPSPMNPFLNLVDGPREEYLRTGVRLYETSIKCDWKAAKAILDMNPHMELVRCSITENGETALHVAASAKEPPQKVEEFVKNMVGLMKEEDMTLINKNQNTALYLAAIAGNVEAVRILVNKNRGSLKIPGARGKMLPLYAAALFGHNKVVKFLYKESMELCSEDGWTAENRGWLLEKCVENDMFDIALTIVEKPKNVNRASSESEISPRVLPASFENSLRHLARKPNVFCVKKPNFIWGFIISVFTCCGLLLGACEKETKALKLLRIIWNDIVKKPKREIDRIIRGPTDEIKQDKRSASGRVVQVLQLQELISKYVSEMKDESEKIKGGLPNSKQRESTSGNVDDQALHIEKFISKHLVAMRVETLNIIRRSQDSVEEDSKPISGEEDQVMELQKIISEHIVKMHVGTHNIIRGSSAKAKEIQTSHLQYLIDRDTNELKRKTDEILNKRPAITISKQMYSSRILFVAAEMGNTKFLVELIRQYPDLIWKVNDQNQTIFHIAVKHRHEGIYNLLYEIGAMKDLITPLRDPNDNNMLHLVGKIAKQTKLEDVSGVAFQMQQELLWFQEVEAMIPLSYRERKNKDGLTPHELFTKEHKDLLTLGEEWMKGTANQCMIVAALIATIVFAAAFTVPGGYNQDNGIPIFKSEATFIVFVVADVISLFTSSAAILMFLSILTSRYAERDFLQSLPRKLMYGVVFLFLSITTMTVAFTVSFFVLYNKGLLWIPILIAVFAVISIILYTILQSGLFLDVLCSSYRFAYLFKPQKHVLYYENPRV